MEDSLSKDDILRLYTMEVKETEQEDMEDARVGHILLVLARRPAQRRSSRLLLTSVISCLVGVISMPVAVQYPRDVVLPVDREQCEKSYPPCKGMCMYGTEPMRETTILHGCGPDETIVYYKMFHDYFPSTLSEMAHDWRSPEGRIFFGTMFVSSITSFLSFIAHELQNTMPLDTKVVGAMTLGHMRNIFPPLGQLVLASVPYGSPHAKGSRGVVFANCFHVFSTTLAFSVLLATEGLSVLCMNGFFGEVAGRAAFLAFISDRQRRVRTTLWLASIVTGLGFVVVVLFDLGMTDTRVQEATFGCEVCTIILTQCSLFVIWLFCRERHYHEGFKRDSIRNHIAEDTSRINSRFIYDNVKDDVVSD